jgi:acetate kinase
MADALDHESGLLGVSGRSSDVRELEKAEAAGDEASALALELFVARAAAGIATAATSLAALDGIVFTGGIGEHASTIRKRIVDRLGASKIGPIDASAEDDRVLTAGDKAPAVLRIAAREDVVIAETVQKLLGSAG